jgi:unsaturated rhamnogalacturonyl hydrolase
MMASKEFSRVLELADLSAARADLPKLRWMWGDALYLWSLSELDSFLGEDRYQPLLSAWCRRFTVKAPRIDQSDTCAPGLVTWAVYRKTGDPGCLALTKRVVDYLEREPRLYGDAPNHLGHSPEGCLYPKSIWVDSLMMFGVLAARYAAETGNTALLDLAARQPRLYASLLEDNETGLFRHSWWARSASPYPSGKIFWGRGNGWVVASLPMILADIGKDHPERNAAIQILGRISSALLPLQRQDGWWNTLLDSPWRSYRESSATALIAAGFMRAAREGWLEPGFGEAGARAFSAIVTSLGSQDSAPCLREVSAPTIPLPLFPRLGYALVPRRNNLSYGLAAVFLAAIEREKLARSGILP